MRRKRTTVPRQGMRLMLGNEVDAWKEAKHKFSDHSL